MEFAFRPTLARIVLGFLAMTVLLGTASYVSAQDAASLTGVVTDASGAVIEGVVVKLVDTKTSTNYEAKTNSVGAYTFSDLQPGPGYQITFSKDGFATVTVPKLYLAVNTTHNQNAQLKVGASSETIEVKGESSAVTLDTTDASVGNSFDMNMVHELPVQIRDNVSELLRYQPGVTSARGADDDNNSSRDGSITGSRTDQGNITVDGLDVNDFATGQSFYATVNAPVDSVQEFHGEVANQLSSEGRGSGGQIALVTKSGTNRFHGAAYDYYRTKGFEANDFFNNFSSPVVPRENLVRNQFGAAIGGPIIKDKLFFFFNYEGRRNASSTTVTQVVPTTAFAAGNVSYINDTGGVSTLTPAQVALLDPLGIGPDPGLTSFLQSRYPAPNSTSAGDGLNTAAYVFNSPTSQTLNDYVAKVDYNVTSKQKIFVRGSLQRETDDRNPSIQFPGDPLTFVDINHSWAAVFGHTWTISNTKVNQFVVGETKQEFNFPYLYAPLGTTTFTFDGTGTGGSNLSSPYMSPASQGRTIPIPVFRDDFTYVRGTHTFQVGGNFKPIKSTNYLINDFNSATIGLGGGLSGLDPTLRPANIDNSAATGSVSQNLYDSAFSFILGHYASVQSSYNNNRQLQPYPQGTGHHRTYQNYETEVYLQDSWKARSDLTLTYGLRYQFYSVPYEVNGLEAIPNLDFNQVIQARIANGLAGNTGCPGPDCGLVNPIITYSLGGKANHAAPLYHPDWHDFQPRFAFAYNPGGVDGPLGALLGDRKTVIRASAALVDDHTAVNALNFLQDQNTWILQSAAATIYGQQPSAGADLAVDPRFTTANSLPAGSVQPPPAITTPYAPWVTPGTGNPYGPADGLNNNQFNYALDPGLKTPYSETFSLGIQRELPGSFQLDLTYVGRFAHRLLAQSDALQTVDFRDPASGQLLSQAYANLTTQERNQTPGPNGYNVTPIPFFENQIQNYAAFGFPSGTSFVANATNPLPFRGDVADSLQLLNEFLDFFGAGINPGVGLSPQFGTSLYMTNKGYSNYNGLLATLHKKMSHGLEFDLNYTWSHSMDNISAPANQAFGSNGAGGILCDSINIGVCYGNSDFDVQNAINGDFVYALPVGRGKAFGNGMSHWADEVVGGWQVSGLVNWRTGLAFQTVANAFPISFANNVPAIFTGNSSAISTSIHTEINPASGNPTVQLFKNQTAALGAFTGPVGLEAGSRNNLRGPHYSDFDIGLAKHFRVTEQSSFEFRADAFNVFNHTNFSLPGGGENNGGGTADITSPSTFGVITSDATPRVLQLALRFDF